MKDLFSETLTLERIEMLTRIVSMNTCNIDDKELALGWVAELTSELLGHFDKKRLNVETSVIKTTNS